MNLSLFGQNLILVLFGIVVAIGVYLISKIDKKYRTRVLPLMLILGLGLSALIEYITGRVTQSSNELPGQFWLMILPFALSLCILPAILFTRLYIDKHQPKPKKGRKKAVEILPETKTLYLSLIYALEVVLSAIFMLLVVNNYYHYYPTLGTVFNVGSPRSLVLNQDNNIVLQYSNVGSKTPVNNIESSVYNNDPTTKQGVLYSLNIPGTVSKFNSRSGFIYVPSVAFNTSSLVKLPVLVLLPGFPGYPSDLIAGAGIGNILTSFAKLHHGITPIVYIADDSGVKYTDTECVNSPRGNVETYLTVDVPNYLKKHFNVSDNAANWAIGGISMGGTCSVMLTLTNPNVYHYFIDIAGDVGPSLVGTSNYTINQIFGGSVNNYNFHQPLYLLDNRKYSGLGGFFGNGNSDTPDVTTGTNLLYQSTKQDNFDVIHEVVNGGHTFNIFNELLKEAIPWISNRIGATQCAGALICQ